MSKLETAAEMIKLAQLLGLERHAVGYLATLPPHEIRRLREATVKSMFKQDSAMFSRLAQASRLLPNKLVAFLGEQIFGPLLAARISGQLPPARAVEIAQKMSIPFLAEVAVHLEPETAKHIIAALPPEMVAGVAVELAKRGQFVVMGRFVDFLGDKAIRTAIEAITDNEALLHVGFFMESKKRLDGLVRMLPDARLRKMIAHAQAKPTELWPEALAMMAHVKPDLAGHLGDLTAEQDDSLLAGLAQVAHDQQLWGDILPVIASMSSQAQNKLLQLPILQKTEVMNSILNAADEDRLWASLLPQIKRMSEAQLQTVAGLAVKLPTEAQERIIQAARDANLWDQVFDIISTLPQTQRKIFEEIVARFAKLDHGLVEQLADQARRHGLGELLDIAQAAVRSVSGGKPS